MFSTTLLDWFALNGRDLPWRHTKNPYAIWLSEVILQQTRIQQGMDYWLRFMQRWPRVEDLAAASEDEVLREWQGLGYYSRARNLHAAAQQIAANGSLATTRLPPSAPSRLGCLRLWWMAMCTVCWHAITA